MPLEAKPLFRPDVLRKHLAYFNLSEAVMKVRAELAKWAGLIESNRINVLREQEILPDFLTVFFGKLLGYTGPADSPDRYTLSREKYVEVDGKYADAVLGVFLPNRKEPIVALEGKGPKDPLDRPFAGRKMSAVDQAYRYAINLPCDWIIVTSICETRLYHKGSTQQSYERFETVALAEDQRQLEKFVFLLGTERVAPLTGRCHLYDLLTASEKVGQELTKKFYVRYADIRQDAFEHLCLDNPDVSRHDILQRTQKLLDRILFCAFCKDRALLPRDIIEKAYQHRDPYNPRPIWDNFRGLFRAVDKGDKNLGIDGYNGGLFEPDKILDLLNVPDKVCGYFRDLASYDYRPAHEVAADATAPGTNMVDVEILGHIFEQSITDLEKIRNELDGLAEPIGAEKHKSRRKKEGAFYTPNFITRYIVEQALGPVLRERFERLRRVHAGRRTGANKAALADPNVFSVAELTEGQRTVLMDFWKEWETDLTTIRLLDPACGSGAFLIEAFTQFRATYQTAHDRLAELRGHVELYDFDRQILEKNLFGVDLNEEAIEICRLSLWIRTAERGKTLTNLDPTIRVGNSVVSDLTVHPLALDWRAAFPHVFSVGGFDVVVGNPPYVRQELFSPIKPYLETSYTTYHGMADLYVYFYELGMRLLKPGGFASFISSNSFARAAYATKLRKFLCESCELRQYIDLADTQVFSDAKDVYPAILVLRKPPEGLSPSGEDVQTMRFRRDQREQDITETIRASGWKVPIRLLNPDGWRFDSPEVNALRAKVFGAATALGETVNNRIWLGLKTGLNEAFVVDDATRERLVTADRSSEAILKSFIGGQDVRRWYREDSGQWLILLPSGLTRAKCGASHENNGWRWLEKQFPAVAAHLAPFAAKARKRTDHGEFWWELRSCDYYDDFERPKILYPDIAKSNRFFLDTDGVHSGNTTYFLPLGDYFLAGVLNSRATWFALAGLSVPFGERAGEYRYRLFTQYVEKLPIPRAGEDDRARIGELAKLCGDAAARRHAIDKQFQRRLSQSFGLGADGQVKGALNTKAQAWWEQSLHDLGAALKASFKLKGDPFKNPKTADEWEPYLDERRREVDTLADHLADAEAEINQRVYYLFHLTRDEIKLLEKEMEH